MRSRKGYKNNMRGFTLLEVIIVIGIFAFVSAFALWGGLDDFARYGLRGERDALISTLMAARSRAMNNLGESAHGAHIAPDGFTLFRGSVFDPLDPLNQSIQASASIAKSGDIDVVFAELSGALGAPAWVTLDNGITSVTISINNEGAIEW